MDPGDTLPPEIYRLDAHRLPRAKARARRRASVALAVAAAAATVALAFDASTLRAALDWAFGVATGAAILAPYALWRAGRRVRRSWNGFEVAIGPHSLRVAAPGVGRVILPRDEIARIVETSAGLSVRTAAPARRAEVPVDIEAYTDIRARLAAWSPVVRRRHVRAVAGAVALAVACGGAAAAALAAPLPSLAAAGLVFVAAVGALAVVDVALRPGLAPGVKAVLAASIGAGLYLLFARVLGRMG
jgi:hypothetical protein